MNTQIKAFRFSIYIHVTFLILVVLAGRSIERLTPPIVIDFSLETLPLATKRQVPSTTPPLKEIATPKQPAVRKIRKKAQPIVKEVKREEIKPVSKTLPEPVLAETPMVKPEFLPPEPVEKVVEVEEMTVEEVTSIDPVSDVSTDTGTVDSVSAEPVSPVPFSGIGAEAMLEGRRSLYRSEHFFRIREMIIERVRYPVVARRRGLEGEVKVSFIVCRNGKVKDVKIQESSGAAILDKHAVHAVMNAAPFPFPPMEVRLVIPISYKLT